MTSLDALYSVPYQTSQCFCSENYLESVLCSHVGIYSGYVVKPRTEVELPLSVPSLRTHRFALPEDGITSFSPAPSSYIVVCSEERPFVPQLDNELCSGVFNALCC